MRITGRAIVIAVLVAALAGCAGLPDKATTQVDGRAVEYALTRQKRPPVILVSGLGGTMDWWAKVYPSLSATNAVLAYNRWGYGRSAPSSAPRDGAHVTEELRATLRRLDLLPPHVLVGHSLGGMYVQLYARRYPNEVSGLALVDSTHRSNSQATAIQLAGPLGSSPPSTLCCPRRRRRSLRRSVPWVPNS